jgi:pimeloyl-ACP methyl ester carboxylesterase
VTVRIRSIEPVKPKPPTSCELVIYPREGHGPQEEKHLLDINRRLLRWFETHLK